MELSIIIVNWNTREYLRGCLESIRENPPSAKYEVIVVDNASVDGSAEMVRAEFPEVRLIANSENLCYAEGNNQGIEAGTGRYLLLLNPDTRVNPGSIDNLMAFMQAHVNAAAAGCRLIGADGGVQRSCRSFPDPAGVLYEYTKLSRIFPSSRKFGAYRMTYFNYDREAEVDQPMGSCLILSRKAIEDVGMFDKDFPIFFNEVDWCYRARQNNWKIYFTPSAEVMHYGGAGTRQVRPKMIAESHRSLLRFYEKHYKGAISPVLYRFIRFAVNLNCALQTRIYSSGD